MKIIGYGLSKDKKGLIQFFTIGESDKHEVDGKIGFERINEMTEYHKQVHIALSTTPSSNKSSEANLGCATTGELIDEIKARAEVNGSLNYRTIEK